MLRRLRSMTPGELRFRVACGGRKAAGRVAATLRGVGWRRDMLAGRLVPEIDSSTEWREGIRALEAADYHRAHVAFAAHFARRVSRFPLAASDLPGRAAAIRRAFPAAPDAAASRANAMLCGRYDLLGYRGLEMGHPPDWHLDPVHHRRSPVAFWTRVRYLDPALGDHKIVWEINRHQHWLALGRAAALTGDPRFYRAFTREIASWMAANPPLTGTNWTSMLELAFRACSWLWALEFFAASAGDGDETPWIVDLLLGLDRQLRHIEENLSRFFSPNTHLSGEALALFVAGTCLPELVASRRRARLGRDILVEEAQRQVRPDGGHAELSAHYHRYSTDFYLMAAAVARRAADPVAAALEDAAGRQARYLRTICDDLGRRPAVGDDDGGQLLPICGRDAADCSDTLATAAVLLAAPALAVGAPPEETFWVCGPAPGIEAAVSWPSTALPDSGYFVSRTSRGDHLLFDAGPFGFLNGGHAHADALSCTLAVRTRPVLIDPGTATYTMSAELRDRFRSPIMHNTVVVDGRSHSVPRGPFHWSGRTDAKATAWRAASRADYAEGTHDGYAPRRHTRAILVLHDLGWLVVDHLLGAGRVTAEGYWHLHPMWRCTLEARGRCRLESGDTVLAFAGSAPLTLLAAGAHEAAVWSPAYGIVEPAPVLRTEMTVDLPWASAAIIPADEAAGRGLTIEPDVLQQAPGPGWHGCAFRITWNEGTTILLSAVEEQPGSADAVPPRSWGTPAFQTDGRCAARVSRRDAPDQTIVVGGHGITMVSTPAWDSAAGPSVAPPNLRRSAAPAGRSA